MDIQLDFATLVGLAGDASASLVMTRLRERGHDARRSHGYIIQCLLVEQPTIGELAATLGMTQQGASKHVSELERLGYVERVPDSADNRVRRVRLTARGNELVDAARSVRADIDAALADRVTSSDLETTRRVLLEVLSLAGVTDRVSRRAVQPPD